MNTGPSRITIAIATCAQITCAYVRQKSATRPSTSGTPIASVTREEKNTLTPSVTTVTRLPPDHAEPRRSANARTSAVISA